MTCEEPRCAGFRAWHEIAVGFAVAFVTAVLVVRWLLNYVGRTAMRCSAGGESSWGQRRLRRFGLGSEEFGTQADLISEWQAGKIPPRRQKILH
jgi:hypothetical protein